MKIRLLAGCILFSSLATTALAQNTDLTDSSVAVGDYRKRINDKDLDVFRNLADRQREFVNKQKVKSPVELTLSDEAKQVFNRYRNEAEAINDRIKTQQKAKMKTLAGNDTVGDADMSKANYSTLVFASLSMPKSDIEEMYRSLAGATDTTIVFRGLPKGTKTINKAIAKFQQIARDLKLKVTPNVTINPILFTQYNVTAVPTIVRLAEPTPNRSGDPKTGVTRQHPKEIASVQGLISPVWLYNRIREGRKGYLGRQGAVYAIEELDIIEEMQRRAANVDWEAKKKAAYSRVWKNIPFEELSPTPAYQRRVFNPTFVLTQDIKDTQGNVIAQQGTTVNPLTVRDFDRLLVVFDASDPHELSFVERNLPQWKQTHNRNSETTQLIMTGFDREKGWDEHTRLVHRFNSRLYLLQSDIKNTFRLRHHPSIVYQEGTNFVVEEFKVD